MTNGSRKIITFLCLELTLEGGLELLKPQCHKELSNYRVDTTQDAKGVVPIFCLARQYQKEGQRTKGGSSEVKYDNK